MSKQVDLLAGWRLTLAVLITKHVSLGIEQVYRRSYSLNSFAIAQYATYCMLVKPDFQKNGSD